MGATGAYLGGGIGRLQGLHGLTSDNVKNIRMALWNGTIIDVNETSNTDLFWGMRGAGQNFGFVIETTFETYAATNGGNNYEAQLAFNIDSLGDVVDAVNSLIPLDPNLALVTIVGTNVTEDNSLEVSHGPFRTKKSPMINSLTISPLSRPSSWLT